MRNFADSISADSRDEEPLGTPLGDLGGFLIPFQVDVDRELLQLALTHRSWAHENGGAPHNERLEFLGDSVLGQAVTAKLYRDYPELSEGELSKRRSALVSTVALAEVARGLELGELLRLGKSEKLTGGRNKDSILADAVEAIIGAVFLSTDLVTANRFVLQLVEPLFSDPDRLHFVVDPKTTLQVEATRRGVPQPRYETTGSGPAHDRLYTSRVTLDGSTGEGTGTSKKAAELAAARHTVELLQQRRAKRKKPRRGSGD